MSKKHKSNGVYNIASLSLLNGMEYFHKCSLIKDNDLYQRYREVSTNLASAMFEYDSIQSLSVLSSYVMGDEFVPEYAECVGVERGKAFSTAKEQFDELVKIVEEIEHKYAEYASTVKTRKPLQDDDDRPADFMGAVAGKLVIGAKSVWTTHIFAEKLSRLGKKNSEDENV